MTIVERIDTYLVDLATIRPHHLSMTEMRKQTIVIIHLFCSDGFEGLGEATTIGGLSYGAESPESIKTNIDTYFSPLLVGQDATGINSLMALLNKQIVGNNIAKSGIETALLDAQGKRLGVPVYQLLGGAVNRTLPVLWTLASGVTAKDIEEAKQLIQENKHNVFKLKIGWQSPELAVKHVSAIKSALGDSIKVTVDVNQAWDEPTAKKYIAQLENGGIDLVEQPIARTNMAGMARLTKRFRVPIMADESLETLDDAYRLSKLRSADVYAIKIGKHGGLLNTLKVAAVAESAGVELYGGTLLEGTIGTMASAHVFSALPKIAWGTELFGPLLLKDDIVQQGISYGNNALHLSDIPGLGIELDMDKLNFYNRKKTVSHHVIPR